MNRYFQCVICKRLIVLTDFVYRDQAGEVITEEFDKIRCDARRMIELNEKQHENMLAREKYLQEAK